MEILTGSAEIADVTEFVERTDEIARRDGVTVQAFDARYVADSAHLRRATDCAVRAIEREAAIADDPGVEILLYAAGRRQIDDALEMGLQTGPCEVALVVVDCDHHDWQADVTGKRERETTERERNAVEALGAELETTDKTPFALPVPDRESSQVIPYFDISEREREATDGTVSDLVRERVALLVVER